MSAPASAPAGHAWSPALLAALACCGAWLIYRNLGLNPTVFADEWYYSKMSRLAELSEAIVPSYLYLWLFRASNACGSGFLDCVRIGNVVLFVGAAPFVYLVARAFTGTAPALLVALFALLAPLNVFTAYFMPEATYYLGFCAMSWVVLTRTNWPWARYALASGAILGLMSLVKVHALFLLPALCLSLLYASWQRGGRWLARGLLSMGLAALTVVALKFGLGYLLAGAAGLNLLGPFYQSGANAAGAHSLLNLLAPALINARGHLMTLAVLLGLPLAVLAHGLVARVFRARGARQNLLHVYLILILVAAVGMTVAFTATLAHPGSQEGLRLHLRYYSFAFPLLWVVAAAAPGKRADPAHPALRWAVALLLVTVLAIAIVKLPTYSLNAVDGPEIFAVKFGDASGRVLVALQVLALLLWALGSGAAASLYMYVMLPALLAAGVVTTGRWLDNQVPQSTADKAGLLARRYVPPAEHGEIIVAASDLGQIMRAQFHIDHKDSMALELPPDAPVAPYQLSARKKWLLVLGKHALPEGIEPLVTADGYALARFNASHRPLGVARFSEPFGGGLLAGADGLAPAEQWGRWSEAKQVVLRFNQPLPRHLNLILKAQAYGDNANLPFTMRVGQDSARFRLGPSLQEVNLRFRTDGHARSVTIEVPHPVSPAELGQPGDPRKLGIGIAEIELGDAGAATLPSSD
jgi:hypothetical protein